MPAPVQGPERPAAVDMPVYRLALRFLEVADRLTARLPRDRYYVIDQLRRASLSVVLNIAEGAGEFSRKAKGNFYRIALRSARECAGVLDALEVLEVGERRDRDRARQLLNDLTPQLTRLSRSSGIGGQG